YKDSRLKNGVRSACKKCISKSIVLYRKANIEKTRELDRRWRKKNPEKYKARLRKWVKRNPERAKELKRNWDKNNPEKTAEHKAKNILKRTGTPVTPENVELAKTRIKLKRIIKQLEK